jgi:hypothetical protein
MITKSEIVKLLETNNKAVARALVCLNARQTDTEQQAEATIVHNGRGFRPCHARMGTSMATFYVKFNRLSDKQVAYWRRLMADGNMRIGIYAGQLLEVAQEKAALKNKVETDERARLEYNLGMVMDSDDPAIIAPAKNELDDFMAKIREKNK